MQTESRVYDLDAEVERLADEMEAIAEKHANWEGHQDQALQYLQRGRDYDRYINGLERLRAGGVESIELQGLTAGHRTFGLELVDRGLNESQAMIALASVDAPWVEHNASEPLPAQEDAVTETAQGVANLPAPVFDWLDERVGDLTNLESEMGNGYMSVLEEKLRADSTEGANG